MGTYDCQILENLKWAFLLIFFFFKIKTLTYNSEFHLASYLKRKKKKKKKKKTRRRTKKALSLSLSLSLSLIDGCCSFQVGQIFNMLHQIRISYNFFFFFLNCRFSNYVNLGRFIYASNIFMMVVVAFK
jgi:hypothetical protein